MLQLSTLFTSLFIVGFVGLHCCWAVVWLWGVGLPSSCSAWAAHCVACSLCGVFTAWHAHCMARSLCGLLTAWPVHCVGRSLCGVFTAWHAHCVARSLCGHSLHGPTHCMGPLTAWAAHRVAAHCGPLTAWLLTVACSLRPAHCVGRSPRGRSLWPAHHMAAHCDPLTAWPLTAGPGAGGLGSGSSWALVDRLRNCGA